MIQSVKVTGLFQTFFAEIVTVPRLLYFSTNCTVSILFMFLNIFLKGEVTINYNKLHADPKQGKTLDISKFSKTQLHQ